MNTKISFQIFSNKLTDASPIIINYNNGDSFNVKSAKLGGTKNHYCETCPLVKETGDLGHPGKIILPDNTYLIKPAFIKSIANILNNINACPHCTQIKNITQINEIIAKHNMVYSDGLKFLILKELGKNVQKCLNFNCGLPSGIFKFSHSKGLFEVKVLTKIEYVLTSKIYTILKSIPPIVLKALATNSHPFTPWDAISSSSLFIPSMSMREPVKHDNTENNALTSKLYQLDKSINSSVNQKNKADAQQLLIEIDNDKNILPYKKKQLETLEKRVGGTKKDGILRSNILARRLDNSGRAVCGPGRCDIGYINIPEHIANILTTSKFYNKTSQSYINNLIFETDKVKYIIKYNQKNNGLTKLIKMNGNKNTKINDFLIMNMGDKIELKLSNNDNILVSRQPSLHKYNIQNNKVKIWSHNTIGIPPTIANSFNADYDGDELNLQKLSHSDLEADIFMSTCNIFKNNFNFSSAFGLIQDLLIMMNVLYSMESIPLSDVVLILGKHSYFIRDIKKTSYTGKELLSLIFPDYMSFEDIIQNGKLILDNIDGSYLVPQSYNTFINLISQLQHNSAAIDMLNVLFNISVNAITYYGFSIKITDLIPNISFIDTLNEYIDNSFTIMNWIINKSINNSKNNTSVIANILLDYIRVYNYNKLYYNILELIKKEYLSHKNNSFMRMWLTKYKITDSELVSLIGMRGFAYSPNNIPVATTRGRVFCTNVTGNVDLESVGYIKNSLIRGISLEGILMDVKHKSLIDIVKTTCETSTAGSTGRKIVKYLEGVKVDAYGMVVLEDSLIMHNCNYIKLLGGDISKINLIYPDKNMINYDKIFSIFNIIKTHLILNGNSKLINQIIFPINIGLLIGSYKQDENEIKISEIDWNLKINNFIVYCNKYIYLYLANISWLEYTLFTYLDPYIVKTKFNKNITIQLMDYILNLIKHRMITSLSPGYTIGLEYGHNIQEKFTQQSLSSFHSTRKSGMSKSVLQFNEFKDTVELSRKNKQDYIRIFSTDKTKIENIKNKFEYASLIQFDPEINHYTEGEFLIVTITISALHFISNISIKTYLEMYKLFMNTCTLCKSYWMVSELNDVYFTVTLGVKLNLPVELNKYYFLIALNTGICKGKIENTNLEIENIKLYNNDLEEVDGYKMNLCINDISDMVGSDTEGVHIEMNYWFTFKIGGIQFGEYSIKNNLVRITKDPHIEICYTLLAKTMCLSSSASTGGIKKLKDGKGSIIKSALHGIPDSFVNAAWNNKTESCKDVYSNIFAGNTPPIGSQYYKVYINPNKYRNCKEIIKKNINLEQSELLFEDNI